MGADEKTPEKGLGALLKRRVRQLRGPLLWLGVPLLLGAWYLTTRPVVTPATDTGPELAMAVAGPRRFSVIVREEGDIRSQNVVELRCQVNRMPGEDGVRIVHLAPNGAKVKKGDLVVQFDEAAVKRAIDEAYVNQERARAKKLNAEAAYENQIHAGQAAEELARLAVRRAELELSQYTNRTHGEHVLTMQQIQLKLQEAYNMLAEARSRLLLQRARVEAVRMLYRLGFRQKADLDLAEFDYFQAQNNLVRAANAVREAEIELKKQKEFGFEIKKLQLESALVEARVQLEKTVKENEAKLAQLKAEKEAAEREFARASEILARYEEQLKACRLYAPIDGVFIYNDRHYPPLRPGVLTRRPELIGTIPDLRHMQAEVFVHESAVPLLKVGQKATVHIEVANGPTYPGTVKEISDMPEQPRWYEPNVKRYKVVVTIDEEVEGLRPGQTASVEIFVRRVDAEVAVPAVAVVERGDAWWCVVAEKNGSLSARKVDVGTISDDWVEITRGLNPGEKVVLGPEEAARHLLPEPENEAKESESEPVPSAIARTDRASKD